MAPMRATAITSLIEDGADPGAVADIVGHADAKFTMKNYRKTSRDRLNGVKEIQDRRAAAERA